MQRQVIPAEICVVVLDTNPARNLAHSPETPEWVGTFTNMAKNGYSFSLADGTFAELLSQHYRGAISDSEFARMIERLEQFIDLRIPVLPGKRDLRAMINARTADDAPWSLPEVLKLSQRAWHILKDAASTKSNERICPDQELQDERESWIAIFNSYEDIINKMNERRHELYGDQFTPVDSELDEHGGEGLDEALRQLNVTEPVLGIPMSIRCDLQVKVLWRQFVRSRRAEDPYLPTSPKKRNDGTDFDLYNYFILPAFVVSEDAGFFSKLDRITSFQRKWFWKPEQLAAEWDAGRRPMPTWPAGISP